MPRHVSICARLFLGEDSVSSHGRMSWNPGWRTVYLLQTDPLSSIRSSCSATLGLLRPSFFPLHLSIKHQIIISAHCSCFFGRNVLQRGFLQLPSEPQLGRMISSLFSGIFCFLLALMANGGFTFMSFLWYYGCLDGPHPRNLVTYR